MSTSHHSTPRWLVAAVLVVSVAVAFGRGGGRGGGGGAGGGARGGGYSRGGAAGNGSFGQGAAGANRGRYSGQGPAASGSFAGGARAAGSPYQHGGAAVWNADGNRVGQQQHERKSGLRGPDGVQAGQAASGDQRAERRDQREQNLDQRQQQRDQAREDWQDYADDHEYHGSGYHEDYGYAGAAAAGIVAGAAIGAAVASPPYWTLSCAPTTVVVGATTYYQCGTSWYIQVYSGGEVAYTMTNPPAGY